ncbi:GTP-binding protein [Phaeobacter sp.]|uniref:CobW family GTP-binding protein n=1 Tax=Phaeobacter sp. TaxID=1902409 RepID=UPI0025F7C195|nr:CobW family GTP-binding protein [Phaeobacter sp.]
MRCPVTIVSGYLGAGKTTLINRLLQEDHGLRLTVLVNDFGQINIDNKLLTDQGAETYALDNGCVCCSLGDDLALSLHQILSSDPTPDHIIVEASGVSDPAAIADIVRNESRTSYGGIVCVVDAVNFPDLLADPMLRDQVSQQVQAADLVLISKRSDATDGSELGFEHLTPRNVAVLDDAPVAPLIFDILPLPTSAGTAAAHPAYTTWHHDSTAIVDRRALGEKLASRPDGIYRMKGFVRTNSGAYELHVVGREVTAKRCDAEKTTLVALGPAERITRDDIEAWWQADP